MIRRLSRRLRFSGRYARSRLIRAILGRHAQGVLYDTLNGRLLVNPEDNAVGKRLGHEGTYDPQGLAALSSILAPDSRVLFVGAHVGALLIPIARQVAHACGIEANPATAELLKLNVLINGIGNAVVHALAAGDRDGEVQFLLSRSNSGGSKLKPEISDYSFVYDRPETARVPLRRLDDVLAGERFDLIVMDVEGAETLALRGMPRLLSSATWLHIEYIPAHLEKVVPVSPTEFLDPLRPHFDEATIVGDPTGRVWAREEFDAMLSSTPSADLLFRRQGVVCRDRRRNV